jgi:hypothetical protein
LAAFRLRAEHQAGGTLEDAHAMTAHESPTLTNPGPLPFKSFRALVWIGAKVRPDQLRKPVSIYLRCAMTRKEFLEQKGRIIAGTIRCFGAVQRIVCPRVNTIAGAGRKHRRDPGLSASRSGAWAAQKGR